MKSFLPEPIEVSLVKHFESNGDNFQIANFSFVSGGCINSAGIIDSNFGRIFIKWNDRKRFPGMFEAESKGLELLHFPGVIRVPLPLFTGETGNFSYLVTEYISSAPRSKNYWDMLGQNLAALHRQTAENYGLDHDNYIGSLNQLNNPDKDWITFYINNRLEYQLKLAVDQGKMGKSHAQKFQQLYSGIESLLADDESPSLIHGDLWGGNLMTDPNGEPVIFDPAAYYGHREIELAMTKLFGGFSSRFYEVYKEVYPLNAGFEERVDIYQLYPLLVHVNLFGGGYISQVESVLNRYL